MAQVVEHLPSKHKALSSNFSVPRKERNFQRKLVSPLAKSQLSVVTFTLCLMAQSIGSLISCLILCPPLCSLVVSSTLLNYRL
jgi:hypothetical protein